MKQFLYVISDGTGETASAMVRAALVQYHTHDLNIIRCKNVRTRDQLASIFEDMPSGNHFVAYTLVSTSLRDSLNAMARERQYITVDLLGPLLDGFAAFFNNISLQPQAGLLRMVNEEYYRRIDAIEYTVKHDDGKTLTDLDKAHVILVGISRTSKTPLSVFLSHKGWRTANIPLVLGQELPRELFGVDQRKIVGLMLDHDYLHRIRRSRLERFGQDPGSSYASPHHIDEELRYAEEIFKKNRKWPVINVTDRALEETATEIMRLIGARMNYTDIPRD